MYRFFATGSWKQPRSTISRRDFFSKLVLGGVALEEVLVSSRALMASGRWSSDAEESSGKQVVMLRYCENPQGPSPKALKAASQELRRCHRYRTNVKPISFLARYHGVSEESIVLGVGSSEVLRNVPLAFLTPEDNMIIATPTFFYVDRFARAIGTEVRYIPLAPDFSHDLKAMRKAMDDRTGLVVICNPNTPTGTLTPQQEICRFLDDIPDRTIVLVDEAYFPCLEEGSEPSSIEFVKNGRNVIVTRTLDKFYGLAGLRPGYGIAPVHLMKRLRGKRIHWAGVNNVTQAAVEPAMTDTDYVRKSRQLFKQGKEYFVRELQKIGCKSIPSVANFLFVDIHANGMEIYQNLDNEGIVIRPGLDGEFQHPGQKQDLTNFIRVSIGTMEENEIFIQALRRHLGR